jgi:hypothetical protein
MNNEFGTMWKEEVMAQFKLLYWHMPGGTEKTHETHKIPQIV